MSLKPIEKLQDQNQITLTNQNLVETTPEMFNAVDKINELIEVVNEQSEKIELLTESIKNAAYNFELIFGLVKKL